MAQISGYIQTGQGVPGRWAETLNGSKRAERKRLMSSRVAAIWHFQHSPVNAEKWYEVVFRSGLTVLRPVGRFLRAFLEVEPIFLTKRY
jgi:hypothetical protein